MEKDLAKLKVAVTGAGGLVGSHLVQYLAGKGCDVIALVRGTGRAEHITQFAHHYKGPGSVAIRVCDMRDGRAAKRVMDGVEVVIHAAGTVDPFGSRSAIFDTNVGGTRGALEAAKEIKATQFIYISSLSVITGQGDQYNVDESASLKPCGEAYADSKIEAEKMVMAESSKNAIRVTSLRPGFIYGRGERSWMPRLINSIRQGKAMLIDGGSKETNVIYVGNLCRAVEGAILNPKAYGQVFNLTDGQKVTKKELFDAISEGMGLPKVTKTISGTIAKFACEAISSVAPVLPRFAREKLARYSRAAFRLAGVNQGFNIAKAERDLDYVDRIPFAEGMSLTLKTFSASQDAPNPSGAASK